VRGGSGCSQLAFRESRTMLAAISSRCLCAWRDFKYAKMVKTRESISKIKDCILYQNALKQYKRDFARYACLDGPSSLVPTTSSHQICERYFRRRVTTDSSMPLGCSRITALDLGWAGPWAMQRQTLSLKSL